jgi:hypothetical protein
MLIAPRQSYDTEGPATDITTAHLQGPCSLRPSEEVDWTEVRKTAAHLYNPGRTIQEMTTVSPQAPHNLRQSEEIDWADVKKASAPSASATTSAGRPLQHVATLKRDDVRSSSETQERDYAISVKTSERQLGIDPTLSSRRAAQFRAYQEKYGRGPFAQTAKGDEDTISTVGEALPDSYDGLEHLSSIHARPESDSTERIKRELSPPPLKIVKCSVSSISNPPNDTEEPVSPISGTVFSNPSTVSEKGLENELKDMIDDNETEERKRLGKKHNEGVVVRRPCTRSRYSRTAEEEWRNGERDGEMQSRWQWDGID